jgi:hypothetical protein
MHQGQSEHASHQNPMVEHDHGAARAEHQQHAPAAAGRESQAPPSDCKLMGACDGPMAALFALLSNHGVVPESAAVIPNVEVRPSVTTVHDHIGGQFQPPDPPPPRA